MKRILTVSLLICAFIFVQAQRIQTIGPRQPVIEGSAFQVQYIISSPEELVNVTPPAADSIQIVSGPHHHRGTVTTAEGIRSIDNITYTLVALKTGRLSIGGLTATFKQDRVEKSADVLINVIPPEKASFSSRSGFTDVSLYALPRESNLQQVIRDNIFIRTDVSTRSCYTGEPVVVTFTLYSRLQSTSEVVNSPSLYGFGVTDLLDINEAHISVATINGKVFNTSILRKLALYPETSGSLVIDPMQLKSDIEFDDTLSSKNKIHRHADIASPEVTILVKPLPKDQPESFTGGVGTFRINSVLSDSVIEQGKQVHLKVEIGGRGNFLQLGPPVVTWPDTFESFEPEINDNLMKNTVPAEGTRSYLFHFIPGKSGNYEIPSIAFSYFDPSVKQYRSLSSKPIYLKVIPSNKIPGTVTGESKQKRAVSLIWIVPVVLVLAFVVWFLMKKKNRQQVTKQPIKTDLLLQLDSIDLSQVSVQQLCTRLQRILSEATRQYPALEKNWMEELQSIRNDCQLHAYSSASSEEVKEDLVSRMKDLVKKASGHSAYL